MWDTAGEVRSLSYATFSDEPLHKNVRVLEDGQELIYHNSVRKHDIVKKICLKRYKRMAREESQ